MIRWSCDAYKERFTKQSCSFWSIYAPIFLSARASPRPHWKLTALPHADPLASLGVGPPREGERGGEEEGKGNGEEKRGREGEGRGLDEREDGHPQIFRWIDAFG